MDLTRAGASTGGRPSSISLIREATQVGLEARGFEPSFGPGADLTLVDVLDDGLSPWVEGAGIESLYDRLGPLLVRVHAVPGDHAPATGLRELLSHADGVIVSTRSHLVRLGSAGLLQADRTDLIAPAAPEMFAGTNGAVGEGILVLGEDLPEELEQALYGLSLGCSVLGPDAHDSGAARRFRSLLARHEVAVLTEPEHGEDGVIAAVCAQLGRALVAPGGVDLAAQPHCFPVSSRPTALDWTAALRGALDHAQLPELREEETGEQLDRLARVLTRARRRKECSRPTAA